jgi:O-acetyl-ADP-ribose deacetylase (regulator of RNase III)
MSINIKLGDLLAEAQDYDAIMHGCNCFHGEDGGIAAQIWDKWPMAREMSERHHDSGDFDAFGTYVYGYEQIGRFAIINAYAQYFGGANFDINAFIHILKQVNEDFTGMNIGIPMIGCGIGGADWESVQGILLHYAPDVNWTVIVWAGES